MLARLHGLLSMAARDADRQHSVPPPPPQVSLEIPVDRLLPKTGHADLVGQLTWPGQARYKRGNKHEGKVHVCSAFPAICSRSWA